MAPKHRDRPLCTFTLDRDLIHGLKTLCERENTTLEPRRTTESGIVRAALRAWLKRKGVLPRDAKPPTRKRTRKQPAGAKAHR
jgi:hypothetical protein